MRSLSGILFAIWLVLFFLGKGGFIYIILLCGLSVAVIEMVCVYRRNVPAGS